MPPILTRACVALLVLCAAPAALPAPAPPHPRDVFLAQLAGSWDFAGTLGGKPVRYRGKGRWVLQHGWLRLNLTDVNAGGYEASVYLGFDAKADDYVAHWLDRFGAAGARVVATGRREGRTLVLLFPYPEGAFRDTLTLAADGKAGALLIEAQQKDGSWSTFASYTLRRLGNAPDPQQ
jgi:hypothetical protein